MKTKYKKLRFTLAVGNQKKIDETALSPQTVAAIRAESKTETSFSSTVSELSKLKLAACLL